MTDYSTHNEHKSSTELLDEACTELQNQLLSNGFILERVGIIARRMTEMSEQEIQDLDERYNAFETTKYERQAYDHYWAVYSSLIQKVGIEALRHGAIHVSGQDY